jgi:hypothetical protein
MIRLKKIFYIFCCGVLGLLLQMLAHAAIEVWYLQSLEAKGINPTWINYLGLSGKCALPLWSQWALLIGGVAFGIWLGFVWWKIVYIEHRHWRFQTQKPSL